MERIDIKSGADAVYLGDVYGHFEPDSYRTYKSR